MNKQNNIDSKQSACNQYILCVSQYLEPRDYSNIKMFIGLGDFTGNVISYYSPCELASYIYTGAVQLKDYDFINLMKTSFPSCTFEDFENPKSYFNVEYYTELVEFFSAIKSAPQKLFNFIFGLSSLIIAIKKDCGQEESESDYLIPKDCEIYCIGGEKW